MFEAIVENEENKAKAFKKEILGLFDRIPGIETRQPGPTQRHHFYFDFQIINGKSIGLPGPVMVDVTYSSAGPVGEDEVERVVSMLLGEEANPTWLIITNTHFSEEAIRHAEGFKLRLWGASDLDKILEKHKDAANDVRRFLAVKRQPLDGLPPQVTVKLSDKGWNIPADAFVIPLGVQGALTGSTYRAIIADQKDAFLEAAISKTPYRQIGPTTPFVLKRKAGKVNNLILTTAYDSDAIRPDAALSSILSIKNNFSHIVLPLLGGAQLPAQDVLKAYHSVISSFRFPEEFRITLVVIDPDTERLANRLLSEFLEAPNSRDLAVPYQPHYSNDAVDGQPVTDCLGIEDRADDFARLLASKNVPLPLAIGLFGDWGSGKSFFMKLIRQRMEAIAEREKHFPTDIYCANVAHITFNAWHYLDSNLWPSLALRIFEGVAAYLGGGKPEDPLSTKTAQKKRELAAVIESNKRAKLEADETISAALTDRRVREEELARLRDDRNARLLSLSRLGFDVVADDAKKAATVLGGVKIHDIESLEQAIQEGRTAIGQMTPVFSGILPGVPLYGRIALLGALGIVVGWLMTDGLPDLLQFSPLAAWIGTLAAAGGWAAHRLAEGRKALAVLMDAARKVRAAAEAPATAAAEELRKIDSEIEEQKLLIALADKEIEAAEIRLQQIKSGALVYEFLTERSGDSRYVDGMGIISVLRQDLERLRERLNELNKDAEGTKVERIVLYIDDLDRCDPERVVEVLQAVHLLLAFDLFAVVVAVDPRWLERSLYKRYLPGFETMSEDRLIASEFSPQNYLEKIFQIPYRIPSMEAGAFGRLIDHLRPVPTTVVQTMTKPVTVNQGEGEGDAASNAEESSIPRPIPASPEISTKPTPLELSQHEMKVLKVAAPLIGTPRATKRLMNVYALIRMRAGGAHYLDNPDTHDCRSLVFLLALDIGFPRVSRLVRHELRETTGNVLPMIDDLAARCGGHHQELMRQFRRVITILEGFGTLSCEDVAGWLPYVEDYSFHDTMSFDARASAKDEVSP